jgi:hypothetical protein
VQFSSRWLGLSALERKKRQRGLGRGTLSGSRDRRVGGFADRVGQVGPDDRVVDDGGHSRFGRREPLRHPGRQVGALDDRGCLASDRDGTLEQVEPVALVGEDAGEQGESAVVGRRVDGVEVAAGPFADLERRVG